MDLPQEQLLEQASGVLGLTREQIEPHLTNLMMDKRL